jgi:hypothetical protein
MHKTHHGPDLGEATIVPFIVYSVPGHRTGTQMSFCPGTPKVGVPKFSKLGLSQLWGTHNFVCKPPIEMKSKAKL